MAEINKTIDVDVNVSGEATTAEQAGMSDRMQTALARIHGGIWAMHPQSLPSVLERVRLTVNLDDEPAEEPMIIVQAPACHDARIPRLPKVGGRIGVIPVHGVIGQHRGGDYWADVYTEVIAAQIATLLDSPAIGAVVLDIDSPGGIVYGTPELSDMILGAREAKPIYAVANSMAASAAYWIGSSASKMFVTPSGEAGSIGVWAAHAEFSEALEKEGIKMTLVSAGEFKTEQNPWEPLTDAAKADMKASVDRYHDMFIAGVAAGRGVSKSTVRDTFGKGRLFGAEAAKAAGMVDGIATLGELLAGIMKPVKKGSRLATASAAIALEEIEG